MESTKEQTLTAQVTQEIPLERISDLLCAAFEGGSNHWIKSVVRIQPTAWAYSSDPAPDDEHWLQDYPLNPGGALLVRADGTAYRLDTQAVKKGFSVMSEKYQEHWKTFLAENDDAITGDVFMQCCLFGEIVYG